jgi:DNA-binding transcriptional MerR regulator
VDKSPDAFRTISEVADELDVPQHVLRFWESRFPQIKPMKRGGGRRYYRPDDVDLLRGIRHLLYGEGYTIRGVQRILREQGGRFVQSVWHEGAPQPERQEADETVETEAVAEPHDSGDPLPEQENASAEATAGSMAAVRPGALDQPAAASRIMSRAMAPKVAPPAGPVLSAEDLQRLRQTLDMLVDCRRRLDQALTDTG